jgi:hypothetical protein
MWHKNTDVHHLTVAGANPHDLARDINAEESPFHDPVGNGSVAQHFTQDGKLIGGIVDVWTPEHLTPEQEKYLKDNPHIIDVRHVWPESE